MTVGGRARIDEHIEIQGPRQGETSDGRQNERGEEGEGGEIPRVLYGARGASRQERSRLGTGSFRWGA